MGFDTEVAQLTPGVQKSPTSLGPLVGVIRSRMVRSPDVRVTNTVPMSSNRDGLREEQVKISSS